MLSNVNKNKTYLVWAEKPTGICIGFYNITDKVLNPGEIYTFHGQCQGFKLNEKAYPEVGWFRTLLEPDDNFIIHNAYPVYFWEKTTK